MSFVSIYHSNKTKLYNYIIKMIPDSMIAEDIMQVTFLKLFENYDSIRDVEKITFWIFTTARNEVYKRFREKKYKPDLYHAESTDEVFIPDSEQIDVSFENKDFREFVLATIETLSIEQKEVFLLREYSGFSYREISELAGIDEELVKSRLFKARKKLIEKLKPFVR